LGELLDTRSNTELTIYTGGTFDLFHAGHVNLLRKCSELGQVVVSLNTDEFITTYKGKSPVCSYQERLEVLEACVWVDRVIPNYGGADSKPAIEAVKPNIIAIGTDWARRDYHAQMGFDQDWLDERNISLIYIPYTAGISTTNLKERSANRYRLKP
jgi:glycerol-3-phosphate cytidylyltransferase